MTIAVTGGTGFVGQAVLDVLAQRGITTRALARNVPGDRPEVEWVAGSLGDSAALDRLVAGAEAVIHIAGLTNTPDPALFEAANVAGTAAMLHAALRAGVKRFVFVSSLSAREPQLSAYGASKARAEELVSRSTLGWTTVRPPAVYGPRDKDMFELFRAARYGLVPLPPKGRASLIHVSDLAELLVVLSLAGDNVHRQTFEPDDGQPGGWSHAELARAIGEAVGKRVWTPHLPQRALMLAAKADRLLRGDAAKLTPDRARYMVHPDWVARKDFAVPAAIWQSRISAHEGLKATAAWYREQGWL